MLIVSGRGDRRRHCRWSHLLNTVARTLKPGWARGTRGSRGRIDETAYAVAVLDEVAAYDMTRDVFWTYTAALPWCSEPSDGILIHSC